MVDRPENGELENEKDERSKLGPGDQPADDGGLFHALSYLPFRMLS